MHNPGQPSNHLDSPARSSRHVTSRHLYGFYGTDMAECLGDSPGSAPKSPSHLHSAYSSGRAGSHGLVPSDKYGTYV